MVYVNTSLKYAEYTLKSHLQNKINDIVTLIRKNYPIKSIAAMYSVHRTTIHKLLKDNDIDHQKLKFDHSYFKNIDNQDKAYWLGFIMADGCVSMTHHAKLDIDLHIKDIDHLVKLHTALTSCNKVKITKKKFCYSVHYSKEICNDLIKLGCTPRKSKTLLFPDVEETLVRHLIRGYFDGDGNVYLNRRTKQIKVQMVGTYDFLINIQKYLGKEVKMQLGINCFKLCFHGNKQIYDIYRYLYLDAKTFLERKKIYFDNAWKFINNPNYGLI